MKKTQQFRLYAAEETVPNWGRSFSTQDEAQSFIDDLRNTPWWTRWYGKVLRVEVHVRKTNIRGSCGGWLPKQGCGLLEMAPWHLNEMGLLHEISHVLADVRFNSKAHDPGFARVYLELVYLVMGTRQWQLLKKAFDDAGIEYDIDDDVIH